MKHYHLQLSDIGGEAVQNAGGVCYVATTGGSAKLALKNADGSAKSNPFALVRGGIDFNVDDSVAKVDLYILAPTGHMVVKKNVFPSGEANVPYDKSRLSTTLVIPFAAADGTAASETATGFVLPGAVQPNPAIDVVTIDATEDIDVGTLSTDSGDADGFMDGVSVAVAGYIKPTLLAAGDTMGALLSVLDSANAGDDAPEQDVSMIGKQVTYTLSAGSDTAAGFIVLPVALRPSQIA